MLISELSQKTGVSKDTIRFYEKSGLLDATAQRGENNYRNYNDEAIDRLEFIKYGKSMGFTLSEIKQAIAEWDVLSLEDKAQFTRNKMVEIDEKINQLQTYRRHLTAKLKRLESEG